MDHGVEVAPWTMLYRAALRRASVGSPLSSRRNHPAPLVSHSMQLTFRSLVETNPDSAWRAVFTAGWPGWQAWLRGRRAGAPGPSLQECEAALAEHMPELVDVHRQLVETVDADDEAAAFLSFWCPPRFLGHCSQAVSADAEAPVLVRNYDLDPRLSEGTLLHTEWGGCAVAGMVDGLCGLSDGMNQHGLAVSLAYGGRQVVGRGFGVPIVVRYLLQTCACVAEAVAVLRRLPHHMSYNLTLLDRAGSTATVFIAPDKLVHVAQQRFATNHQQEVEDEAHAEFCKTRQRADCLRKLLQATPPNSEELVRAFAEAPLRSTRFREGFGTVFTAEYRPDLATLTLHWPSVEPLRHELAQPASQSRTVHFDVEAPAATAAAGASEGDGVLASGGYDWLATLPKELQSLITRYWSPPIGR